MPDSGQVVALRAIVAIQQAALTQDLTVDAVMQMVAAQALEITGASGAAMEIIDGDHLEYAHGTGTLAGTEGLRLALAGSLSGLAVSTGEVQMSADTAKDPRVDLAAVNRVGARSMVVVPLQVRGEPVAVLKVSSDRTGAFGPREIEILNTLASFVATVLQQTQVMHARRLEPETYRLISEASADAIIQVRLDGTIMWASPAAEEILGYAPEQLVGMHGSDLIRPDELPRYTAGLQQAIAAAADTRWEFPTVRPDGSTVWVESAGRVAKDERGRALYRVVRLRDISAEREAREQLARSEARFRLAMQNAPIGMCLIGPDGSFLQVNDALCDLLGRPAGVLMKSSWQELTHPDDLDVDLDFLQQVVAGEIDRYRLVKRYLRPNGEVMWGDLAVSCVRGLDGEVLHFISQIVDVTSAMEEQQQTAADLDRYARLVAVGSDVIAELDDSAAIRWISPNTQVLFGAAPLALLGKDLCEFIPDDQRDRVRTALRTAVASSTPDHLEFPLRSTDDTILRVEAVVEPGRQGAGHIIRIRDVSGHHETREELRQQVATDPVTGLLSRAEMERRLEALLGHPARTGTRTMLALVDVGGIDVDGDRTREEVLRAVAGRVREALRDSDLVGRMGGTVLVAMLPGLTTPAAGREVLARLVQLVATPYPVGSAVVRPRLSVGATEIVADEWLEDVLARAQTAMAAARDSGGNRVQLAEPDIGGREHVDPVADSMSARVLPFRREH